MQEQKLDVWVIDESRLGEGFHVQVLRHDTDEQIMPLIAYGLPTEQDALNHIETLKEQHDVLVLSPECR